MDTRGVLADEQLIGDLAVGPADGDERQHLAFARGQPEASCRILGRIGRDVLGEEATDEAVGVRRVDQPAVEATDEAVVVRTVIRLTLDRATRPGPRART